jgi:MFS family permease
MGAYRAVDMAASLASQLMISVLTPVSSVSYHILALLCCAALIPLALTKSPPETPKAPRLRLMLAVRNSPLAAAGVVVAALSGASFRMVGPIYGAAVGLQIDQIAYFLAAFVLGGALAQIPAGWLANKYNRRKALIWLSVAAVMSGLASIFIESYSPTAIFLTALIFGITTFPIFSVASAHAHDFVQSNERVELSAALMFYYALGAIVTPLLALFMMIASGHVLQIIFGLSRMRVRPPRTERTPYIYAPRASFFIGRLLERMRDKL